MVHWVGELLMMMPSAIIHPVHTEVEVTAGGPTGVVIWVSRKEYQSREQPGAGASPRTTDKGWGIASVSEKAEKPHARCDV